MILFVGGRASGKIEAAKDICGIDPREATAEQALSLPAVSHLEKIIANLLDDNQSVDEFISRLIEKNPNAIILCDEVGYGIVPLDRKDRLLREEIGKACCALQKHSKAVYRVVCGIAIKIK